MIVDLANLDDSRWIQLTGNSGHAFHPNYADQFELWRTGQTITFRFDRKIDRGGEDPNAYADALVSSSMATHRAPSASPVSADITRSSA